MNWMYAIENMMITGGIISWLTALIAVFRITSNTPKLEKDSLWRFASTLFCIGSALFILATGLISL